MRQKIEELTMKNRQMENVIRVKEEETYKLRQDNQNMFSDLKGLASSEENTKLELIENKNKRSELEMVTQDFKQHQINDQMTIRQLQNEMEQLKRDTQ